MAETYNFRSKYRGGVSNVYYQSTGATNQKADLSRAKELAQLSDNIAKFGKLYAVNETRRKDTNSQAAEDEYNRLQAEGKSREEIETIISSGKNEIFNRKYAQTQLDGLVASQHALDDINKTNIAMGELQYDTDINQMFNDNTHDFNNSPKSATYTRIYQENIQKAKNSYAVAQTELITKHNIKTGLSSVVEKALEATESNVPLTDIMSAVGKSIKDIQGIPNSYIKDAEFHLLESYYNKALLSNSTDAKTMTEQLIGVLQARRGDNEELPSLLDDVQTQKTAQAFLGKVLRLAESSVKTKSFMDAYHQFKKGSQKDKIEIGLWFGANLTTKKDKLQFETELTQHIRDNIRSSYDADIGKQLSLGQNIPTAQEKEQLIEIDTLKQMVVEMEALDMPYLMLKGRLESTTNNMGTFDAEVENTQFIKQMDANSNLVKIIEAQGISLTNHITPEAYAIYKSYDAIVNTLGNEDNTRLQAIQTIKKAQKGQLGNKISQNDMTKYLEAIEIDGKNVLEFPSAEFRMNNDLNAKVETLIRTYANAGVIISDEFLEELSEDIDKRFVIDGNGIVQNTMIVNKAEIGTWNENTEILIETLAPDQNKSDVGFYQGQGNNFILRNKLTFLEVKDKNDETISVTSTNLKMNPEVFRERILKIKTKKQLEAERIARNREREKRKEEERQRYEEKRIKKKEENKDGFVDIRESEYKQEEIDKKERAKKDNPLNLLKSFFQDIRENKQQKRNEEATRAYRERQQNAVDGALQSENNLINNEFSNFLESLRMPQSQGRSFDVIQRLLEGSIINAPSDDRIRDAIDPSINLRQKVEGDTVDDVAITGAGGKRG